jgi:hypothetical protein
MTNDRTRIELSIDEELAKMLIYISDKLHKPVEDIIITALRLYVGKHIVDIV